MAKRAVIFDLDGTLVNTIDDLADSVNHTLKKYGYPVHEVNAFRYFIGNGARNMVAAALPSDVREQADLVDAFLEEYKQYYAQHYMDKSVPYDGILEMVESLSKENIPLAVCSNKHQIATAEIIKQMFPTNAFCCVYGEREGIPRKPNPAAPLEIAKEMEILPGDILFVGDSDADMLTASHAGMTSVGVAWGFRGVEELEKNGAKYIISKPMDLLNIFHELD